MNKIKILYYSLKGYLYKYAVDFKIFDVPLLKKNNCDIVVSLTSYGRRVKKQVVYYTIVSLLRQKVQPSRIILWLAQNEWNNDTLPKKIKSLIAKGVEIRYCEDLKSYKKLIPSLKLCNGCNIMTVDDDIIYHSDVIRYIYDVHIKHPNEILAMEVLKPILKRGLPQNYEHWARSEKTEDSDLIFFPIGFAGILYPVNSLHKDVLREELFKNLCPLADDVWFWFCGVLNGTSKRYVNMNGHNLSFDALYQYFHKGSALTHTNRMEHQNDKQLRQLFDYYGVYIDEGKGLMKKENTN